MKKLFARLLFGFTVLFLLLETSQKVSAQKKLNDSLNKFQKLGTVKTPIFYENKFDQTIFLSKDVFYSIDPSFKESFERKPEIKEDTTLFAVYKLNENLKLDMVLLDTIFQGFIKNALTQSQVIEFCKTKEIKSFLKLYKNGSVYFLFKRETPNKDTFFVYYNPFGIAEVFSKRGNKLGIKYFSIISEKKINIHKPSLFVVLN
ncbi:MAG: hypothetical protein V4504_02335 [Patescibacteria group bacterium]